MSEYMSPISTPLVTSTSVNPQSNMDVLDGDLGSHGRALAVLVGDFGGDLGLGCAAIEGFDHGCILLGDDAAAQLPRASDLGVVGIEILGEQQETPNTRGFKQALVALLDLRPDQ